jgi:hypothetical protein
VGAVRVVKGETMPPLMLWIAGAVGATVVARWLMREARRINAELDAVRAQPAGRDPHGERPSLKRDPETGIYRPK